MLRRSLLLTLLALPLLGGGGLPPLTIRWYPTYTIEGEKITEGLYVHIDRPTVPPTVVIEATADGQPLPIASGTPDDVTCFLAAPIKNLDTYRIVKLAIRMGDKMWTLENPRAAQEYTLRQ